MGNSDKEGKGEQKGEGENKTGRDEFFCICSHFTNLATAPSMLLAATAVLSRVHVQTNSTIQNCEDTIEITVINITVFITRELPSSDC